MGHAKNLFHPVVLERLESRTLLSTGRAFIDLGRLDDALDVAVQDDGRIVLLGYTEDTPVSNIYGGLTGHFFLARYLPDGSPDPAFGAGGKVVSDFDDFRLAGDLSVGPDG